MRPKVGEDQLLQLNQEITEVKLAPRKFSLLQSKIDYFLKAE